MTAVQTIAISRESEDNLTRAMSVAAFLGEVFSQLGGEEQAQTEYSRFSPDAAHGLAYLLRDVQESIKTAIG